MIVLANVTSIKLKFFKKIIIVHPVKNLFSFLMYLLKDISTDLTSLFTFSMYIIFSGFNSSAFLGKKSGVISQ